MNVLVMDATHRHSNAYVVCPLHTQVLHNCAKLVLCLLDQLTKYTGNPSRMVDQMLRQAYILSVFANK